MTSYTPYIMMDQVLQILGPLPHLMIAVAACVVGGLMRGFSGFGGGLVLTPLFSLLYGPVMAVPVSVLINLLVNVQLAPSARGAVRWPVVLPITVASCIAAPAGAWLLAAVDPELMRRTIGFLVVAFSVLIALGWKMSPNGGGAADAAAGMVGGILNGAAALGGAPITLYLLGRDGSAASKRADLIVIFGIMQIATVASYLMGDLLPLAVVLLALLLFPVYVLASWAGTKLFRRSRDEVFHRVAQVFLIVVGAMTLLA